MPLQEGLGAFLYQEQNGCTRVIAYASRTLTPSERNYHMHSGKLEFIELKWAITEQFRDYFYYAPTFVVYTDNNSLTYDLTTAKLNATGLSWVGELADYSFQIQYKSGKLNTMLTDSQDYHLILRSIWTVAVKQYHPRDCEPVSPLSGPCKGGFNSAYCSDISERGTSAALPVVYDSLQPCMSGRSCERLA